MGRNRKTEAIVFTAKDRTAVGTVPLPPMGPSDVTVRIEYSSISIGTERWCLMGMIHAPGEPPAPFPFVPGYQAAGIVTEVGRDVKDLKPGDRVFSVSGRLAKGPIGSCWGGHVHYHVTDAAGVIKLPDSVTTREAAGLVLAQVGYNGATQPRVRKGDVAVIIGDGLVGQYAGQVLRHRGARVVLSGHHDKRLQLAARLSADEVVNSRNEDFAAYVRKRWPNGVQVAGESAGKNELIRQAIDLLEYHGQLVLLGYYPEGECMIDIHWTRARETTVFCPNSLTRPRLEATLGLIARGKVRVSELITHEFDLADAPNAYQMILDNTEEFLGVVINWQKA